MLSSPIFCTIPAEAQPNYRYSKDVFATCLLPFRLPRFFHPTGAFGQQDGGLILNWQETAFNNKKSSITQVLKVSVTSRIFSCTLLSAVHSKCTCSNVSSRLITAIIDRGLVNIVLFKKHLKVTTAELTGVADVKIEGLERLGAPMSLSRRSTWIEETREASADLPHQNCSFLKGRRHKAPAIR